MLQVDLKVVGRKPIALPGLSLPLPPQRVEGSEPFTLRELITRIVCTEIQAFRERQEERKLLRALSRHEIADSVEKGKVEMGSRDLHQEVDEANAVGTAIQAFEDGLYLVIIDGEEQRELDRELHLRPDSRVTFLRLAMLAGG